MPALPGMSVHREDILREAEARERGYAEGVNDCLAWLIENQKHDTAREMRADFVDQPEQENA